ncbi:putative MFS family arabinose efflux permease [Paenibacillus cellulosilyticus]|uniref:Putative MFS family arabinose efflux permease n=1 Tax=Paenibacillus cellulosilyticus TaxID=375489 RepID=A0A2V2Z046_9BACL|nr:MFS transporter [Paenibacillus cellulosilyticus]PWW08653.1 putative MFS family arabinose efflux permease [Paenibacillus cellulosilyticus]QKS48217.1 MFS transporter [Paenibacillus cellulosilyticus]
MQQEQSPAPLWTRPFIALTASFFLLFLSLQMLISSFPAYVKEEFHVGNVAASMVTSVFALSAIVARFATAALMRRFTRMKLLLAGLIIAGITTALYTTVGDFYSFLGLRIGYGIGFGMASTILPTFVSSIIPIKRMGEGIAYFGLSTSLAMSIGPSIGLNVMDQAGFGPLTMVGLASVVLIFPVLLISRSKRSPLEAEAQAPKANASGKPAKVGVSRNLVFPVILNAMLSITYSGLLSFLVLFGKTVHIEQVGLFFLFNAVTIILIRPISGRIFDRRGHRAVLIPAGVLVAISMVMLSNAQSMPMLIVSALIYGLGFGAIQPTIQAWMIRSSKPEQYGMANSMYYNSTDFGIAIGSILLGVVSSATSYSTMYMYSAGVMGLFAVLVILQAVFAIRKSKSEAAEALPL